MNYLKISLNFTLLLTAHLAWCDITLIESSNMSHDVIYLNDKGQICNLVCPTGTSFDRQCSTNNKPVCMQALSFEWLFRKSAGFITFKLENIKLQQSLTEEKASLLEKNKSKILIEKDILRIEEKLTAPDLSQADRKGLEARLKELNANRDDKLRNIQISEDRIRNIQQTELPLLESKNSEVSDAFTKVSGKIGADQTLVVDKGEHIFEILSPLFNQKNIYLNENLATKTYYGYCSYAYDTENCSSNSWSSDSSGPLIGFDTAEALINECSWSASNMHFGAIKVNLSPKDFTSKPLETAPKYFKSICKTSKLIWDSMHCGYNQVKTALHDVYGHTTKELRLNCQELAEDQGFNSFSIDKLVEFKNWNL